MKENIEKFFKEIEENDKKVAREMKQNDRDKMHNDFVEFVNMNNCKLKDVEDEQ